MRTAIVFGSSGFIGTHLLRKLVETQEYHDILGFDLKDPPVKLPGVEYAICDVRKPINVQKRIENADIFNLAAVHVTPGHDDRDYFTTNVLGAINVCDFAREQSCRFIVFTSSIATYGPSEDRLTETSAVNPESAYGLSKYQAELIHRIWQHQNESNRLVILRPGVIYGPGERGNFTRLARLLKRGTFVYPGRRDTIKACCYVGELVRAMLFTRSLEKQETTLNVSYPRPYTIQEICETMSDVGGYKRPMFAAPLRLMLAIANVFEVAAKWGLLPTSINRSRVNKLVRSTNIAPEGLLELGYKFETELRGSLERWKQETQTGGFI